MVWDAEADAALERWVKEGFSATAIANAFSQWLKVKISRNAVIGRIYRRGMSLKKKSAPVKRTPNTLGLPPPAKASPGPPSPARKRAQAQRVERIVRAAAPPPLVEDASHHRRFMETEFREVARPGDPCRWPLTDPRAVGIVNHLVCGAPLSDGPREHPYCPYHLQATRSEPGPRLVRTDFSAKVPMRVKQLVTAEA